MAQGMKCQIHTIFVHQALELTVHRFACPLNDKVLVRFMRLRLDQVQDIVRNVNVSCTLFCLAAVAHLITILGHDDRAAHIDPVPLHIHITELQADDFTDSQTQPCRQQNRQFGIRPLDGGKDFLERWQLPFLFLELRQLHTIEIQIDLMHFQHGSQQPVGVLDVLRTNALALLIHRTLNIQNRQCIQLGIHDALKTMICDLLIIPDSCRLDHIGASFDVVGKCLLQRDIFRIDRLLLGFALLLRLGLLALFLVVLSHLNGFPFLISSERPKNSLAFLIEAIGQHHTEATAG